MRFKYRTQCPFALKQLQQAFQLPGFIQPGSVVNKTPVAETRDYTRVTLPYSDPEFSASCVLHDIEFELETKTRVALELQLYGTESPIYNTDGRL
jgi:hypothetical protein